MTYRIRQVDGTDEETADVLADLHRSSFADNTPVPSFDEGHWWIGYHRTKPVSFASMVISERYPATGYFKRVGVIPEHRGKGLQRRHMIVLERHARRTGLSCIVSDTTDNPHSANNFIAAGYRILAPEDPWAFVHSIYWGKALV